MELLAAAAGLGDAFPVSCGIDLDRYRDAAHNDDAASTVLFVGRMDREKHVDELIRAFAALPAHVPAQLELIGDGPERGAWTALAAGLGIAHRVRFRGFVSEEALLEAYAHAAVFCMPGTAELQSLATLEAMASGTPVVAADAMALPHLVRPGRNGWLYPPGDVAGLTTRLSAVYCHSNTVRHRLRRVEHHTGRSLSNPLHSAEVYVALEALHRLPERPTRRPPTEPVS